jgi:hypothetical protein
MPTLTFTATTAAGVERAGVDQSWAAITAGVGTGLFVNAGNYVGYADRSATANQWGRLIRLVLPFDTSVIGPGHVIDSATVRLQAFVKQNAGGVNVPSGALYAVSPTTPGLPDPSDYERMSDAILSNAIPFASWDGALTFTLTPAGLAQINPLGWTTIAGRFTWDALHTPPTDWNAFALGVWVGDPTLRPTLDVTYHAAPGAPIDQRIGIDATAIGDEMPLTAIMGGLDA